MTIDRALEIFDMFSPTHVSTSDDEITESLDLVVTALRFMKMMQNAPTCNTCAVRSSCNYAPAWGEQVRYNCPHYVKEMWGEQVRYNCPHHVPLKKGDD